MLVAILGKWYLFLALDLVLCSSTFEFSTKLVKLEKFSLL